MNVALRNRPVRWVIVGSMLVVVPFLAGCWPAVRAAPQSAPRLSPPPPPAPPPVPSLSIGSTSVLEPATGSATATLTVSLSTTSSQPVTVQYATHDATADHWDYTATSGTLTFLPGQTTQMVPVTVLADVSSGNEDFKVILSNPVNASLAQPTGVVTIVE